MNQQVQGVTVTEFTTDAQADYINGLVTALRDEIPGLRASMITVTGLTTVVARRLDPPSDRPPSPLLIPKKPAVEVEIWVLQVSQR